MKLLRVLLVVLLVVSPLAFAIGKDTYKEISWDDLMPEGWEPPVPQEQEFFEGESFESGAFEGESFEGQAYDGDLNPVPAQVQEPAPVVKSLDQQKLKIPGYIIPLKFTADSVSEFLLVPYVGACIHVPPPPENQIVYVTLKEPLMTSEFWTPVWVSGVMKAKLSMTEFATAGYHMTDAITEVYEY